MCCHIVLIMSAPIKHHDKFVGLEPVLLLQTNIDGPTCSIWLDTNHSELPTINHTREQQDVKGTRRYGAKQSPPGLQIAELR